MVVCSCTVTTEKQVKEWLSTYEGDKPSVQFVLQSMGKETVCATCAYTIKQLIKEHYGNS